MESIVQLNSEEMAGMNFQCSCGQVHGVDIKKVKIGNDVLTDLMSSLTPFQGKKILLVADSNTYWVNGKNVEEVVSKTFSKSAGILLTPMDLHLDRDSFRLSLIVAKDVRQRYGVLQLLEDMGILEETADMITDIYY